MCITCQDKLEFRKQQGAAHSSVRRHCGISCEVMYDAHTRGQSHVNMIAAQMFVIRAIRQYAFITCMLQRNCLPVAMESAASAAYVEGEGAWANRIIT